MKEASKSLVARLRAGDRNALEELLVRHVDGLHGYLRLRMGAALRGHEASLDLVQSVCREVLEKLPAVEYRGEADFRHWLCQAAENQLRDRARYWGRGRRDSAREQAVGAQESEATALTCYASFCSPSQAAIGHEQLDQIERAFDLLDPVHRDVIVMHRVIGLSFEEIAERIGQTPHYTRTLLSRALARLSTLLDRSDA